MFRIRPKLNLLAGSGSTEKLLTFNKIDPDPKKNCRSHKYKISDAILTCKFANRNLTIRIRIFKFLFCVKVREGKQNMEAVFQHKSKMQNIISKYHNKRAQKRTF